MTAGSNAEGNDPSLALGRPPRGFPTPRCLLGQSRQVTPLWMWRDPDLPPTLKQPCDRSHQSSQLSDCETEVRDGDSEYKQKPVCVC